MSTDQTQIADLLAQYEVVDAELRTATAHRDRLVQRLNRLAAEIRERMEAEGAADAE